MVHCKYLSRIVSVSFERGLFHNKNDQNQIYYHLIHCVFGSYFIVFFFLFHFNSFKQGNIIKNEILNPTISSTYNKVKSKYLHIKLLVQGLFHQEIVKVSTNRGTDSVSTNNKICSRTMYRVIRGTLKITTHERKSLL